MSQDEHISLLHSDSSSISSNATAPDLAGPGRTIGLVLDWLGDGLETFANKQAAKFNASPEEIMNEVHHTQLSTLALESTPQDQHVAPSSSNGISTNATAPNLPGAGRTVGILLDWLGKGLESFMNKRAIQLNLGPEAVARDILRIRGEGEKFVFIRYAVPNAYLTKSLERKLKKLCKSLLKYANSHSQSTQLKALEKITSLTIGDPLIRDILQKLNTGQLVPGYREPELFASTSRAYFPVENEETHKVWSEWLSRLEYFYYFSERYPQLEDVNPFLIHSRKPYVFGFRQEVKITLIKLWMYYMALLTTFPEAIEWTSVDSSGGIMYQCENSFYHPAIVKSLIKQSTNLQVFFAMTFGINFTEVYFHPNDSDDDPGEAFIFAKIPDRDKKKKSFGGDKRLVIPYISSSLSPLNYCVEALSSSDNFLGHLSFIRTQNTYSRTQLRAILMDDERLVVFRVREDVESRALATFLFFTIYASNRYYKALLCQASTIPIFMSVQTFQCYAKLWRIRVKRKYFFFVTRSSSSGNELRADDSFTSKIDQLDVMVIENSRVMLLPSNGEGTTFSATGHFPIIAFQRGTRAPSFIGLAARKSGREVFVTVEEGGQTAMFCDWHGRPQFEHVFRVLVLRHDPIDFSYEPTDPQRMRVQSRERALDSTGPLFWRQYFPDKDPDLFESEDDIYSREMMRMLENLDKRREARTAVPNDLAGSKSDTRSSRKIVWDTSNDPFKNLDVDLFGDVDIKDYEATAWTDEVAHKKEKQAREVTVEKPPLATELEDLAVEKRGLEVERQSVMDERRELEVERRELEIKERDREIRRLLAMPSRRVEFFNLVLFEIGEYGDLTDYQLSSTEMESLKSRLRRTEEIVAVRDLEIWKRNLEIAMPQSMLSECIGIVDR
ncbi:hypothetical protein SCHPADRAFT_893753 [Schizopora paradoxa]|uniref:Uncharacterized protein n=1 Tax=Schizopora paradoxa TaxID=27342 RepID=A0A0H2R9T2_9AGAM|nr:hypothetical protein SCHPADRAFT_893753 [Schizopora paradoxa]